MIYDIAVGAFIALVLFDLVGYLAKEITYRIQIKRRAEQLREFMESVDEQNFQFRSAKPRKKAVTKKKTAAKRK
jgi:hypothetical protein